MSASHSLRPPADSGGVATEVTRIELKQQFKPSVYLNGGRVSGARKRAPLPSGLARQKKSPAFRRNLSVSPHEFVWTQLAVPLAGMLLLLAGLLLPTALLLTGFLPWILVLLAGFLPGIRVLLTRVLILIAHSEFSHFSLAVGINADA
jgi:hypothetical protein